MKSILKELKGGSMKKKKEKSLLPKKVDYYVICSCCSDASICTFPKNPGQPILQCEEFKGYEPRPGETIFKNDSLTTDPKLMSSAEEKNLGKYKGLCNICEDREICTFPKAEGGVWHCEEYR
jgi:hypothetical protein